MSHGLTDVLVLSGLAFLGGCFLGWVLRDARAGRERLLAEEAAEYDPADHWKPRGWTPGNN